MARNSNRLYLIISVVFAIFLAIDSVIWYAFFPNLVGNNSLFYFIIVNTTVFLLLAIILAAIVQKSIIVPIRNMINRLAKMEPLSKELSGLDERHFSPVIQGLYDSIDDVFRRLKKNLDELEESKEYIETLMKTVQVAIIVFNKSLKTIYINDAGRKILGIEGPETTDIIISNYMNTQVLAEFFKKFQNQNTPVNKELPLILTDGRKLDVDISISPLRNAKNEQTAYIAVIADVTQRKKAEFNLRNQINFSRQIFKAIPDMVVIVDRKLKIMFVNQRAEEVMENWTPDAKDITRYLSKRSLAEGFDAALMESIAEGKDIKKINALNPFVDGENYVDLAIEPVVTKNNILGALLLIRDITDWRNLTRKIEQLQGFTVKLIETSPLGFISVDESFRVNIWNQSAQAIFGIEVQAAQGRVLFDICPQFRQYRGAIRNAMESDTPVYLTEQVISFDQDTYKIVNLRFYQVKNDTISIVINVEDVTEVKELEDSLLQLKFQLTL